MNKFLIGFLLFLASTLILVGVSALGLISFAIKLLCAGPVYLGFTLLALNHSKLKSWVILVIIAAPLLIFITPAHFIDYDGSYLSLPSTVTCFLGILLGYLSYRSRSTWIKWTLLFIPIIVAISGYFFWFQSFSNKANFGIYRNEVTEALPAFSLVDKDRQPVSHGDLFAKKIAVIDFWNSQCLPCFQLFPSIDQINRKKNDRIEIYSINIPVNAETPDSTIGIIEKYGYSFATYYAVSGSLAEQLRLMSYPTTIVVQDRRILYRGEFKDAYQYAEQLISSKTN